MQDSVIELLIEVGMFLLYGVATTVLAAVGTLFEYRSYEFVSGGDTMLALWIGGLGLVVLTLAYRIGRDKLTNAWVSVQAELA